MPLGFCCLLLQCAAGLCQSLVVAGPYAAAFIFSPPLTYVSIPTTAVYKSLEQKRFCVAQSTAKKCSPSDYERQSTRNVTICIPVQQYSQYLCMIATIHLLLTSHNMRVGTGISSMLCKWNALVPDTHSRSIICVDYPWKSVAVS